jgi:hypothetical protein
MRAPAGSAVLVDLSSAQALTNKDLTGAGNTFPNSLVTLTGSQTLTNKTLTAPAIGGATTFTGTQAGAVLDAASTIGGVSGTSLAADRTAWTSYTPTLTGTGGAITSAAYKQIGKTLYLRLHLTFSAVTSATATLPASLTAKGNTGGAAAAGPNTTIQAYVQDTGSVVNFASGSAFSVVQYSTVIEVN